MIGFAISLSVSAQTVSVLYNFNKNSLSQFPLFTPRQGRDGSVFATTQGSQNGTIFRISTKGVGGQIFAFSGANGSLPSSGVTLSTDGNLYGVTTFGGTLGDGILFQVTPSGKYTVLHEFTGDSDGLWPTGALIEASDGNLYGSTLDGPGVTGATIFRYAKSNGFSTILTLSKEQGQAIAAPLIQSSDGNLYGTAYSGGANGCGAIFVLTTSGNLLSDFGLSCSPGPEAPFSPLVQASDGNFYGTSERGGNRSDGTIFKMDSNGKISVLYSFEGATSDGNKPDGGLVLATDGNFYGSTSQGGANGAGTLYEFSPTSGYKLLYSFTAAVGELEFGSLLQHTNGKFYGTSFEGGRQGVGSIYTLDMGLGAFITFVVPSAKPGQTAQILGQGLTGATSVTFDGVSAKTFSAKSDTFMTAVVPDGATTGPVVVTTPAGKLTSNVSFRVLN